MGTPQIHPGEGKLFRESFTAKRDTHGWTPHAPRGLEMALGGGGWGATFSS